VKQKTSISDIYKDIDNGIVSNLFAQGLFFVESSVKHTQNILSATFAEKVRNFKTNLIQYDIRMVMGILLNKQDGGI
jgi:hypothetical protein